MNFRLRIASWFSLSLILLAGALVFTAHWHLDEELRRDRWDRTHPHFPGWVIHGSYTDEEVQDILGELFHVWLAVGIPLVVASLAVGYVIALRSSRPVRRINRELASLSTRSLSCGVSLPEQDKELATLVQHINDLLERVGRSYNEMAEFSARVAHELRTPLTLLRMKVESSAAVLPPDFSEDVQEEIRRLSQLVERSLLTAKAEGGRLDTSPVLADISELVEEFRESYLRLAQEQGIRFQWRVEPGIECVTDPGLLRQVLHNLIGNAVRHGRSHARLRFWKSRASGKLVLIISNFVAYPAAGHPGTGIGLRLVRSLAQVLGTSFFRDRIRRGKYSVRFSFGSLTAPTRGRSP